MKDRNDRKAQSGTVVFRISAASQATKARFEDVHPSQNGDREHRKCDGRGEESEADRCADRRKHPDHRRSRDSGYDTAPSEDDASAEKTDPRDDLTQYAGGVRLTTAESSAELNEDGRTQTDQNAGPDANGLSADLPLQPDHAGTEHGDANLHPKRRSEGVECVHAITSSEGPANGRGPDRADRRRQSAPPEFRY